MRLNQRFVIESEVVSGSQLPQQFEMTELLPKPGVPEITAMEL